MTIQRLVVGTRHRLLIESVSRQISTPYRSKDEPLVRRFRTAASVSDTCIHTMQDLLGLDDSVRMNIPATVVTGVMYEARSRHTEDFLRTITSRCNFRVYKEGEVI